MVPAARISAAIEILADLDEKKRPANDSLKDWGLSHRFAGSKDRAAIASLVFDALRRKASSGFLMASDDPRAHMLGTLKLMRGMDVTAIAALCNGQGHAPAVLSDAETHRLGHATLDEAPDHIAGDFPEWLKTAMARAYPGSAIAEGQALSNRAPVDLRVNTLKARRERQLADLAHLGAIATPWSPIGLRLPVGADGRGPALTAEPAMVKGLIEVQDEGSQLATLLSCAKQGQQVLDLCAGGGGKTLALAGMMGNKGQIYASDDDGRRLMPIFARLERAGARNVQVRAPKGGVAPLSDLAGTCDIVLVDAPCTGSGTWRRNPDAKWRMRPGALEQRMKDQDDVLASAAQYVKKGGLILYITCSILAEENEDRIALFLSEHPGFAAVDPAAMAVAAGLEALAPCVSALGPGLRLSPLTTATDGFFVSGLRRT